MFLTEDDGELEKLFRIFPQFNSSVLKQKRVFHRSGWMKKTFFGVNWDSEKFMSI